MGLHRRRQKRTQTPDILSFQRLSQRHLPVPLCPSRLELASAPSSIVPTAWPLAPAPEASSMPLGRTSSVSSFFPARRAHLHEQEQVRVLALGRRAAPVLDVVTGDVDTLEKQKRMSVPLSQRRSDLQVCLLLARPSGPIVSLQLGPSPSCCLFALMLPLRPLDQQ
jgi:hypothetical protein